MTSAGFETVGGRQAPVIYNACHWEPKLLVVGLADDPIASR